MTQVGFQPRNTPAERRAFFDQQRKLQALSGETSAGLDTINDDITVINDDIASINGDIASINGDITGINSALALKLDREIYRGTRAAVSYPAGDTAIGVLTQVENSGCVSVSGSTLTFLRAGTYAINPSIGGASMPASSFLFLIATSRNMIFPLPQGTTLHGGGTMLARCEINDTCTFTFRNGGTAVSLSFSVIVTKAA